jgi:hypothetical protein
MGFWLLVPGVGMGGGTAASVATEGIEFSLGTLGVEFSLQQLPEFSEGD